MIQTNSKQDPAALREDIDQARAELGQTVQELAERVDVPNRMRAASARAKIRARASSVPWVLAGGAAGMVAVAVVFYLRRGRR